MNDLKEKFSNKIHNSEISDNPFDHLYIENFFEDGLYEKILENIPEKSHFQKIIDAGRVKGYYSPDRYILSFKEDVNKLTESQKNFWTEINSAFFSKDFWVAISSKFKSTLDERFKNLSNKEKKILGYEPLITFSSALIKDYTKYHLGAHTDSPSKMFSLLFYLPKNNNLKNIGTALYRPLDIIDESLIDKHFTREGTLSKFEKVKTCEFKMNSVFIFPRTNYSFHGVETVNINESERNLFLVNFHGNKRK